MNPIRLLTKLNPNGCSLDYGSLSSEPEFTAAFVAAALGRLPRLNSLLLLWTFCMDDRVAYDAPGADVKLPSRSDKGLVALTQDLIKKSLYDAGMTYNDDREKLARAILIEIRDTGRCLKCNGRGYLFDEVEGFCNCTGCKGGGHDKYSDRRRARLLGINPMRFRRKCRASYETCFRELASAQEAGLRQLWHQCHRE